MVVGRDDTLAERHLAFRVVDEQSTSVLGEVPPLVVEFAGRLVGQERGRPDLSVRMRVGRPRHLAARLEELDPFPAFPEFRQLPLPQLDHPHHVGVFHLGQAEVVAWREAEDAALTHPGRRPEQCVVVADGWLRHVGEQRREVVGEHERLGVVGVADAAGALVARAEVTRRVVDDPIGRRRLGLAVPGASGSLRRHHDPLVGQRIEPTMRVTGGVERHAAQRRSIERRRRTCTRSTQRRRMSGLNERGPRRGTATPTANSSLTIR